MPLPGILGFTFLEPGKKSENIFSRKNRKKSGFIGNYRDFSEKSAIFCRNFFKRFFHGFFFSTPADNRKIGEKSADFSDFLFLALNQPFSLTLKLQLCPYGGMRAYYSIV